MFWSGRFEQLGRGNRYTAICIEQHIDTANIDVVDKFELSATKECGEAEALVLAWGNVRGSLQYLFR